LPGNIARGLSFFQHSLKRLNDGRQCILFRRQRDHRQGLRKIRVGRGAREQLELFAAAAGVAIEQPWTLPGAYSEAAGLEQVLEGEPFPAGANDHGIRRVRARALLFHPHGLLAAVGAMDDPAPVNVL
jgi:hypothetical protein